MQPKPVERKHVVPWRWISLPWCHGNHKFEKSAVIESTVIEHLKYKFVQIMLIEFSYK